MVLMREASPTARSLEHPRRGFLAGAAPRAAPNSRQDATRRALGRDRVRCRRRDRLGRTAARFAARVMSYSQCQTAQSSSFPRALLRPGSFSSLSLPILRNIFRFFVPRTFVPGSSFLPSQLPIPDRGDGGAPGGGILYPVARVIARRHVCEAWAVPRNRNGASRRSTVTVLGPLRARLRSCLRLVCAGNPCCRHRFRSDKGPEPPDNGFTTRPGTPPPAPPSGSPRESAPR